MLPIYLCMLINTAEKSDLGVICCESLPILVLACLPALPFLHGWLLDKATEVSQRLWSSCPLPCALSRLYICLWVVLSSLTPLAIPEFLVQCNTRYICPHWTINLYNFLPESNHIFPVAKWSQPNLWIGPLGQVSQWLMSSICKPRTRTLIRKCLINGAFQPRNHSYCDPD